MVQTLLLVSLALAIYYLLAAIYFAIVIAIAFAPKGPPTKKKPL
jgi:ABC-type proline/glycine betaine transport system permease subunit